MPATGVTESLRFLPFRKAKQIILECKWGIRWCRVPSLMPWAPMRCVESCVWCIKKFQSACAPCALCMSSMATTSRQERNDKLGRDMELDWRAGDDYAVDERAVVLGYKSPVAHDDLERACSSQQMESRRR